MALAEGRKDPDDRSLAKKKKRRRSRGKPELGMVNGNLILTGDYGLRAGSKEGRRLSCKRALIVTACTLLLLLLLTLVTLGVIHLLTGWGSVERPGYQEVAAETDENSFTFPVSEKLRAAERDVPARIRTGQATRLLLPSRRIVYTYG